jgi:hypothetical protein
MMRRAGLGAAVMASLASAALVAWMGLGREVGSLSLRPETR